jgi:hypothetical protein
MGFEVASTRDGCGVLEVGLEMIWSFGSGRERLNGVGGLAIDGEAWPCVELMEGWCGIQERAKSVSGWSADATLEGSGERAYAWAVREYDRRSS